VLIRRNKKSRVATTAETCCDGLEIIRRGRSVDIDTDRVTGFMEVLDLLVHGFLADLFAVLLVQTCVSTKQSGLGFIPFVELVQVIHVVSPVLILLTLR